ncbi:hypothetical protein NPIL_35341 [Nephila pilipes]|uniref:Uncharacterized protein n=1 Tax=Nephila pilipes TaxID=299642 RepID=A0A8X6Q6E0_NEPPI|nr:hypothetical protein NPIL_35341 [Nephila pilipes]
MDLGRPASKERTAGQRFVVKGQQHGMRCCVPQTPISTSGFLYETCVIEIFHEESSLDGSTFSSHWVLMCVAIKRSAPLLQNNNWCSEEEGKRRIVLQIIRNGITSALLCSMELGPRVISPGMTAGRGMNHDIAFYPPRGAIFRLDRSL